MSGNGSLRLTGSDGILPAPETPVQFEFSGPDTPVQPELSNPDTPVQPELSNPDVAVEPVKPCSEPLTGPVDDRSADGAAGLV